MQDGEQESIAVVDYEDPATTEAIKACDARTGERLDSEEVRKGRAKEVRELDEFEVKMEVDESEMRETPGQNIWSKWVETRKDPNSPAIRCRWCATEVNTFEPRSDTFAATPPLKCVRLILSWAASYKPKRANVSMIIAVFDISVAFFHGDLRDATEEPSQEGEDLETAQESLRNSLRKSSVCAERGGRTKHLVCTGETISSLAFQMTGRTISNK